MSEPKKTDTKFQPIINSQTTGLKISESIWRRLFSNRRGLIPAKKIAISAAIIILLGLIGLSVGPVSLSDNSLIQVTIANGATSNQIGGQLAKRKVIRSAFMFDLYVRATSKNAKLQAGTYRLSPRDNLLQIVSHLENGSVDRFNITFYPGATLTDHTDKARAKKQDVTTVLENAGYSDAEITEALNASYSGPLFNGRPDTADLEGYVYGDTYAFNGGATVKEVLQRTFDEFYAKLKSNNLLKGFNDRGLSTYEAITLASVIQKEDSDSATQPQIAQVFYSRLNMNMVLGSDVTYIYAANKLGVTPSPSLDSPYNTRIKSGLPPGPISVPSLGALKAVAYPASGDYLYFLTGDDGKMYFAKTFDEHKQNIDDHCQVGCYTAS